jgi:hypothetical protein
MSEYWVAAMNVCNYFTPQLSCLVLKYKIQSLHNVNKMLIRFCTFLELVKEKDYSEHAATRCLNAIPRKSSKFRHMWNKATRCLNAIPRKSSKFRHMWNKA